MKKVTPEMIAEANRQSSWREGREGWLKDMAEKINEFIKKENK